MYRQSSGRNHRSKGLKVKNILQICVLIAVCFWLIYQVKHSHDKKEEFDESDTKASSTDERLNLGRKDIQTRAGGTLIKDEKLDDDDEINREVEEAIKQEEDEKVDVKEDDGDEETDEHEQEKPDGEVDKEHDLMDGEEREDGDENETQNADAEDGLAQVDEESTSEDTDRDADDSSAHDAREEHYKADDASSAVTHDTQIETSDNEHAEHAMENKESEDEETSESENREELEFESVASENEETFDDRRKELLVKGDDGHESNLTTKEVVLGKSVSLNNTTTEGSSHDVASNGTGAVTNDHSSPSENFEGNLTETIESEGGNNSIDSDAKELPTLSSNSASVNEEEEKNEMDSEKSIDVGRDVESLGEIQTVGANREEYGAA